MHTEQLQCFLPGEKRIAISFEQVGNLWIEQWQVGKEPDQTLLLKSVNTSDSDWPENPPWQEVIKESHGGLPVIMAIGRAGRSHWSAAWKVLPAGVIHVEYACRIHAKPEMMGASLQLARGVSCSQVTAGCWSLESGSFSLHITAGKETSIDVSSDGLISIRPIDDGNESLPRTMQWQYRIA